jgi:hypothetical protein
MKQASNKQSENIHGDAKDKTVYILLSSLIVSIFLSVMAAYGLLPPISELTQGAGELDSTALQIAQLMALGA